MKQEFWKSIPFWVVVVTNVVAVVVLIVSDTPVSATQIVTQAGVSIITILGAANNPTNPAGFGANEVIK